MKKNLIKLIRELFPKNAEQIISDINEERCIYCKSKGVELIDITREVKEFHCPHCLESYSR